MELLLINNLFQAVEKVIAIGLTLLPSASVLA